MATDVNKGFDDQDQLRRIREDVLNPIAVRVTDLRTRMTKAEEVTTDAFIGATPLKDTQEIAFTVKGKNPVKVDLTGMFREGSDLALVDGKGNKIPKVNEIAVQDGLITNHGDGSTEISYDWDKIVTTHQDKLAVGKFGQPATQKPNYLVFKGATTDVNHSGDVTTVTIPEQEPFSGKIGPGTAQAIDEIHLIGNTSGSTFDGTTLQIHLPDGGSGPGASQNFQGFFSSLGDVESQIPSPVEGKTLAYAQVNYAGGLYYDPYFYVNGTWQRLKPEPSLVYSPATGNTQGVYSIKPDDRITIDSQGQVDLSGLSVKPEDQFFHGFFETQADLDAAVPKPTLERSFAYVKHNSGAWIGKTYKRVDGSNQWTVIAPIGATCMVDTPSSIGVPTPIYGIYNNNQWEVDTKGIMSLKPGAMEFPVEITSSADSTVKRGVFDSVQYMGGSGNVFLNNKKLFIQHPQQIIEYDSTFEDEHNDIEFMGNLYYDKTSRTWMGWGVPETAGAVDKKWSRVLHPKMSDEVKDLSLRNPPKAPYADPGILGDTASWRYTGWTYIRKDDPQLPEAIKEICGAYISTIIQDVENDTARPQERFQICYADQQNSDCFVRTWNKGSTTGSSDYGWRPWVKISMNQSSIDNHNEDPNAHKNHHKFYKVGTVDATWAELKAGNSKIKDSDLLLIADSHGISKDGEEGLTIPYDGQFRFSGRVEFDSWKSTSAPFLKPQFIMYVYKITPSLETIIAEFGYNHSDHTKPVPPLKWKSGPITLKTGDKIRFEFKEFTGALNNETNLRMVPSRTYFVVEDVNTTAGSRIATTHKRTMGAINSRSDVGVNVHLAAGSKDNVRVYGLPLATTTVDMNKIN